MARTASLGTGSVILAAAALFMAPIAGAQRAISGVPAGTASPRAAAPVMTAAAAPRAASRPIMVRPSNPRATPTATRGRSSSMPKAATAANFLNSGTLLDPYLNSGTSPLYIDGVLNAGPGSAFYGSNSILGVKAFIDPVTQLQLATFARLRRAFGSAGIYVPLLPGYAAVPEDDQTGEEYASDQGQAPVQPGEGQPQQPPAQIYILREGPDNASANGNANESQNAAEAEQPPLRDEGEFLLIFRDGRSDNAAAFTKSGDQVIYITPEGTRQTVALNQIDLEATQRVNQERGTPLQLSTD